MEYPQAMEANLFGGFLAVLRVVSRKGAVKLFFRLLFHT